MKQLFIQIIVHYEHMALAKHNLLCERLCYYCLSHAKHHCSYLSCYVLCIV